MKKIVLHVSDEDFEKAEQIAEMGNFDSVDEYFNAVIKTAISEDGDEFLKDRVEKNW